MLQPGQYEDLETIAEGWNVPAATAAYAILAEFLSGCRGLPLELGPIGLKVSASCRILAAQGVPVSPKEPCDE